MSMGYNCPEMEAMDERDREGQRLLLARRKLAFKLAEDIQHHFPEIEHAGYDVDEAAKLINMMIPSTRDESIVEYNEFVEEEKDKDRWPQGPSILSELTEAVHATGDMSIRTVLRAAASKLKAVSKLTQDLVDHADWTTAPAYLRDGRLSAVDGWEAACGKVLNALRAEECR